jgi:class 3 adenylate cyclase/alpha-beta hydrolase superfamily lysophospholipase
MTPETRYARTTDGTHVAYQVHGEGPVDILVLRAWHSNLDHEWQEPVLAGILRRLASLGRVIRLDRRGTGLSDRFDPASPPTLEHRIDDIRATLDAADAQRVVAVGLAHGGALCAFFAATFPERTAGLVLWSPPPSMIGRAMPAAYDARRDGLERGWGTDDAARETVRVVAPSRIHDTAFVEWVRDDARLGGSASELTAQWSLVADTSVDGILSSIHVPALVLWRSGAATVAPIVASKIPDATAIELPGNDHMFISGDWRAPLAEIERFVERVSALPSETDRVLVTVVFTDIVGSTERAAQLGDRAWRELVDRHHRVVRRELARYRGREIDTAGDGFFAAFDAPARAIRCAIAIRTAVGRLGLELRIGIHAGECERVDGGLRGVAVHAGARIAGVAGPGDILVSRTVRDLVAGSGLQLADAGPYELKGLTEPWQLHRVMESAGNPDQTIGNSD